MANAEAVIEGNEIVIRLAIENIPIAVEGGIDMGTITGGVKVVDAPLFAKDVVRALNDFDESGTTIIHQLFDQAFENALDDGAQGAIYKEDKEWELYFNDGEEKPEIEMIDGQPDWNEDDDDLPW
jgi:hypothetical protein